MTNQIILPHCAIGSEFVVENKSDEPLYVLSFLTGEKKLEPVKYYVIPRIIKYKWWFWEFEKTEWAIETEFSVLSGFESKEAACMMLLSVGERPCFK